MNQKKQTIIKILSSALIAFSLSFFAFKGIYFVFAIPFVLLLFSIDKKYVLSAIISMIGASLIIDFKLYPIILVACFSLTYLIMLLVKNLKMNCRDYLAVSGAISGAILGIIYYLSPIDISAINIFVIAIFCYLLTYNLINIEYDLKLRDSFSLTKKQLAFVAFSFNLIVSFVSINILDLNISFILAMMANYIFIRIDPLVGIIGCSTLFALNISTISNALLSLIPMVFLFKNLVHNKYFRGLIYLMTGAFVLVYMEDYTLAIEVIIVSLYLLFVPDSLINLVHKYIIEPQDYELKLYQKSYYKCLNRNKKIQKVMTVLEQQMQSNDKMKKSTKEIIFKDMQFLSDKLKEEDNFRIKEQILTEFDYNKFEILECKIENDYFNNYKIKIEIKNDNLDENRVLEILQEYLDIKLKISNKSVNKLLSTTRYTFVNDQKLNFNIAIKQRSKDASSCGDSYVSFDIKNKKYLMISDGMGHGKNASKESTLALLLLKDFIELGMSLEDAIVSSNALLFNKGDEKFNTLDLLEYDIFDNKINLFKNGSGFTYIKNKDNVQKIASENLPLGIIENIKTEKIPIDVDSQYIILTSDGFKKDLTNVIANVKCKAPKSIIEEIFDYEGDEIEDDQTIVVINIIKNA